MHLTRTAIVTGANGFIGSYLAQLLLDEGWTVHALGRAKDGIPWEKRVDAALVASQMTDRSSDMSRLHCHEADLTRPDLGFPEGSDLFAGSKAVLVHLAGDTRFVTPDPEAQRRANVEGTIHVVRALRHSVARMVHVSTAYVAGDRTGRFWKAKPTSARAFTTPTRNPNWKPRLRCARSAAT